MSDIVNQAIANDLIRNAWSKMIRERSKSERAKYQAELKANEREYGPVAKDRGYKDKALLNWDSGQLKPAYTVHSPMPIMPVMPDYSGILEPNRGEAEKHQNTAP